MDPLSDFLDGRDARPVVSAVALSAPWEIAVGSASALVLVAVVEGRAGWRRDDDAPAALTAGDVLLLREPGGVTLRHAAGPATLGEPPAFLPPRRSPVERHDIHVTGADPDGPDVLLVAAYPGSDDGNPAVTSPLPDLIRLEWGRSGAPLFAGVATEAREPRLGGEVVCARLADLAVVEALRAWFAGVDEAEHSWLRASWDPVVGAALQLIHDEAGHPWDLRELADAVGCARTTLSRRFAALVGEAPMTYLAQWRLTLAADLLTRPGATVSHVARELGYTDPFAFVAAFARRYGQSPQAYRLQHRPASAQGC